MQRPSHFALKLCTLIGAALSVFVLDVSAAHAQSASCERLEATLATLDRNRDFRNVGDSTREAREVGRQVQRAESAYVRQGCNDDAKAGRRLSSQCRQLARDITQGREEYEELVSTVETGNAVAEQREALLQEIARFGCGSRVRVLDDDEDEDDFRTAQRRRNRDRGNIFDQLFGDFFEDFDGGGGYRDEGWDPYGDYHTVRTLCVRKSDGFYWPISYSTLTDYVPNDYDQCVQSCPGVDVDLYYYDNPGQEPEQAINQYGEPYASLPNAFKFRTEFDKTQSCKAQVDYGSITIAQTAAGQSRAIIEFNGVTFPLPLRDPRQQLEITQAALEVTHFVEVPLPRRRPAAPGEEPRPVPVTPVAESAELRIVQFGDKRVRIVGPDTPYAQAGAAGT
jgi:hypothetical protein